MKAAILRAFAALMTFASANAAAATFEILNPPGATGRVQPTVIHYGIVGGWFDSGVNVLGFTFSRQNGYTTFDVPGHRFFDALSPSGIDRAGRIYGSFNDSATSGQAFVRDTNGDIQTFAFPAPGIEFTDIFDVNVRGTAVGRYIVFDDNTGTEVTQGFMHLATGQIVPLRFPNSTFTQATGNNDNGEIVGYTGFSRLAFEPFFRGALGPWTLFELPAGCRPPDPFFGGGIFLNNSGTAAGYCAVASQSFQGFIRTKAGELKSFKVPGSTSTMVSGIADSGNVAGTYTDASGTHAYIRRSDATYFTFDAPTAAPGNTRVSGYSEYGDLVGSFTDANNVIHGFVRYKN